MTPVTVIKKQEEELTEDEVIALIKAAQGKRSVREFAKDMKVSSGYLGDVLANSSSPGQKILDHFGITKTKRVVVQHVYVRRRKHAG
jgi:hypothetical protein